MEDLRQAMPSIPHVLEKLYSNPNNTKLSMFSKFCKFLYFYCALYIQIIGDQLERLLILEYEFGALPGFTPAVDAVIEFLTTVRSAIRIIIIHRLRRSNNVPV